MGSAEGGDKVANQPSRGSLVQLDLLRRHFNSEKALSLIC